MRGYFGIGVEGLSKPLNAGNLFRSAHAFGASFFFTVGGIYNSKKTISDTSNSTQQVPLYEFNNVEQMLLPKVCRLIGIELLDNASYLPTFKHPPQAAYVLGPERGTLSEDMIQECDDIIKIPTTFCVNLATAGAIVMYDRALNLGGFGDRALSTLNGGTPKPKHIYGQQIFRSKEI